MTRFRGLINMACIAGVGFGGWKLREKYDGMVGAVKPTSVMARLSQLWDGIVVSSEDDGKKQQVEENDRRRLERDLRNLAADVEALKARLDDEQSYRHEFPPLPPPPARRPALRQ